MPERARERPDTNGWPAYAVYVLKELERLADNQEKLAGEVKDLTIDQAVLKATSAKAGAASGGIIGAITSGLVQGIAWLINR